MHPYFDAALPHLFGHRGASGEAPENTLVGFERAWRSGVRYLEMDCHATRDGCIVIHHDPEVDRTTDGSGPVAKLSFSELRELDAGHRFSIDGETYPYRAQGIRVPSLDEVLKRFPEARINLEIKGTDPGFCRDVVRLVQKAAATDRVLLAAAEDDVLEAVRRLDPKTAIGSSIGDIAAFLKAFSEDRLEAFRPAGHALQIPPAFDGRPLVTEDSVNAAHRVGLFVHVWTVNEPEEMRRLLELGVDGLMSDYPARLIQAAEAHADAARPNAPRS